MDSPGRSQVLRRLRSIEASGMKRSTLRFLVTTMLQKITKVQPYRRQPAPPHSCMASSSAVRAAKAVSTRGRARGHSMVALSQGPHKRTPPLTPVACFGCVWY
jgi:hypothetical protein